MSRLLSYAVLHGDLYHPLTGTINKTLMAKSDSAHKAVKMTQLEHEVLVEIPYARDPKKTLKVLIDNSGFTHRVLADE